MSFIERAKELSSKAYGNGSNSSDFYVVWFCKTLQNWKALVSTDVTNGFYFEVTHNGSKNETYVDVYQKSLNKCFKEGE